MKFESQSPPPSPLFLEETVPCFLFFLSDFDMSSAAYRNTRKTSKTRSYELLLLSAIESRAKDLEGSSEAGTILNAQEIGSAFKSRGTWGPGTRLRLKTSHIRKDFEEGGSVLVKKWPWKSEFAENFTPNANEERRNLFSLKINFASVLRPFHFRLQTRIHRWQKNSFRISRRRRRRGDTWGQETTEFVIQVSIPLTNLPDQKWDLNLIPNWRENNLQIWLRHFWSGKNLGCL